MADDRDLVEAAAARVVNAYGDAEDRLLSDLARRLAAGQSTGYDAWMVRKLSEARAVQDAARRGIQRLDGVIVQLMAEEIDTAYGSGLTAGGRDLIASRVTPPGAPIIGGRPDAVQALAEEAVGNLSNTHLRMLRDVDDAYRLVQAEVAEMMATGTTTLPKAIQSSLDRYATRGISGFVDSAGRAWGLQEYAEMQTRTAALGAMRNGRMDQYREAGQTLVIVSDSPEECPVCRPWEGEVLGLDARVRHQGQDRPSVGEARMAGLFHPNCTHTVGVYVSGLTKPLRGTANPQGYDLRQTQRYHERQIRKWKRRQSVANTSEAQAHSAAHLRTARGKYKTFVDSEDRIPVAWRTRVLRPTP